MLIFEVWCYGRNIRPRIWRRHRGNLPPCLADWPQCLVNETVDFGQFGRALFHLQVMSNSVFCLGFFCRARRPAPFSWRPALLKKPKWRPALLTKKKKKLFFLNISSTWLLALFVPFCCPHTAWIVLCIFYWAIQGHFLVSSALFHPFTALKCPFDGPFTALKCSFDGPFTALKCPFQMAPCPSENLGRTL